MRPENKVINGFWQGPTLTHIQKLCIRSYQNAGHDFHLWVTEPTSGIPGGVTIGEVNDVFDEPPPLFAGANYFSDFFRVELIRKIGGWYVDLDTVCLRHFDFPNNYAFVSEPRLEEKPLGNQPTRAITWVQDYLSGCIFKAPKDAPFLKYISDRIRGMDTMHPPSWICMGPELFKEAIFKFDLTKYIFPPSVFDAMNYNELNHFISGGKMWNFSSQSHAIHLRTSFWEKGRLRANGKYPEDSLYEQLKRKHGV